MARHMTSIEEYRRLLAGVTSEDDLLTHVATRLTLGRWRWTHVRRSDKAISMGDPGVPDIIAVRGGVLLVRELKAAAGRFETGQQEWLADLAAVRRVDVGLWRPADIDEVERRLL